MGPSGTFANVADSLITGKSYMGYGGSQRSLNEVHAAGGNCVDLSLMLLDAAGQMGIPGHLGLTTWNGNSHAFANIGGQIYDPAHKILSGNWGLPPQGPGGCADGEHHIKVELNINGPVYDANDIINNAKPLLHQLANEVFSKRSRRDYVTGDY
jgi:hypothetical protein